LKINSIHEVDLNGKYVVIEKEYMKEGYTALEHRIGKAVGGFGCSPNAMGRAVFIEHLSDGESARWSRSDLEGWVEDTEVAAWQTQRRLGINKELS
jgi:hypothetical protein